MGGVVKERARVRERVSGMVGEGEGEEGIGD